MKNRYLVSICCVALLSGCATEANFSKALEKPVEAANAAKLVVVQAEREIEKARAMGWIGTTTAADELACGPLGSTAGTLRSLSAFGEALTLVKDVAEKPAGDSYAAYLQQFRMNRDSLASAAKMNDKEIAEQQAAVEKAEAEAARVRCLALYQSDVHDGNRLAPAKGTPESSASLGALSSLVKGILAAAESTQREDAVRKTAVALIPGLKLAHAQLSAAPSPTQPHVEYKRLKEDAVARATAENRLGATISVHRWFVARQIEQSLAKVRACDNQPACLGDPLMRMTLDNLANDILSYRELATIDTPVILKGLGEGIASAEKASTSAGNWAQVLEALMQIHDALAGLKTQYDTWQDSRK